METRKASYIIIKTQYVSSWNFLNKNSQIKLCLITINFAVISFFVSVICNIVLCFFSFFCTDYKFVGMSVLVPALFLHAVARVRILPTLHLCFYSNTRLLLLVSQSCSCSCSIQCHCCFSCKKSFCVCPERTYFLSLLWIFCHVFDHISFSFSCPWPCFISCPCLVVLAVFGLVLVHALVFVVFLLVFLFCYFFCQSCF